MKIIIQRVSKASVSINENITASINYGFLILLGIENEDTFEDINWLTTKIEKLRIFNDDQNNMNLSINDINGEVLVISQFTLHALTKKGNRPSFIKAAKPEIALPLYHKFINQLKNKINTNIQSGEFGAMMKIKLINDGPVTIIIDSKNKE